MRKLIGPAATILWIAGAAHATTIVPIADAKLVDRAPIVVVATVESRSNSHLQRPATDWIVAVDRVLKGHVGQGRIVVRLPGGEAAGGRSLKIYGSPELAPGRRALLFLVPRGRGTFVLADFPQGAFLAARGTRRSYAFRDFSEVRVLSGSGRVGAREPLRDFDRFADWIDDRARGVAALPDYLVQPTLAELKSATQAFTVFSDSGFNMRWFEFDNGGSVSWRSHTTPLPGLAGGGVNELQRALTVWNNEPTTPINLVFGGTSSASAGFTSFDSQNVVLWNDPNDEIAGAFSCDSGGTLAIGGPWYDADVRGTFNGKTFIRIGGADVVINNGVECKQFSSPNYSEFVEEVTAHEVGHGLGLGHSSEKAGESNALKKNALMYFRVKDNGGGAVLNADDVAGIQFLYRKGGSTPPPPPGACPLNTLCLLKGRFRVTGTWNNQFDGSSGAAIPITNTDLSGFFYFSDKSNIELIIKILDSAGEVKVFYSQLTNLRFTLTVTEVATGRTKTYSNTAGECGAIDLNFATGPAGISALTDGLESITAPATASCLASTTTLCLLNRRFAITVDWRNQFDGSTGVGKQKTLSILTGAFSFTDPANLEILIKTLDHGANILVIYGALSNLEYTIRVTDTTTGAVKTYHNPAGQYCGGLDTNAF